MRHRSARCRDDGHSGAASHHPKTVAGIGADVLEETMELAEVGRNSAA
jgi:hypothetical protein